MFSGNSVEYITPNWLYRELDDEFSFSLDPCTTKDNPLRTSTFFTKEDDGLKKSWSGHRVYVNPPYGKETTKWLKKAFDSVYVDRHSAQIVVILLPVRTDTEWFHRYVLHTKGCEIRFIRGRLQFDGDHTRDAAGRNTAPFPSMVVVFEK